MKTHRLGKSTRKNAVTTGKRWGRTFEVLEGRAMLASDSLAWMNPLIAEDVDNDLLVTSTDLIKLIDALNRTGPGTLDPSVSKLMIRGSDLPTGFGKAQYLDVTGDGLLSTADALQVIDKINRAAGDPDTMNITATFFDVAGNPITEILAGTDFLVGIQAEDTRAVASGVLSAYADVKFNSSTLASFYGGPLGALPSLQFNPQYTTGRNGSIITATPEVDDAGAVNQSIAPPAFPDPVTIWTTTMRAAATAGTLNATPDDAELITLKNLVYNPDSPAAEAVTQYLSGSINIVTDTTRQLSINDAPAVVEGDAGSTNAVFTVSLNAADLTRTIYVIYSSADVTASAGSDYTAQISGTLTFVPGDISEQLTVPVLGDTVFEGNETFNVNLLFASNATIGDGVGIGTIIENDPASRLTVSDAQVLEGDSPGTVNMDFTVELTPGATVPVIVGYSTAGNSATSGTDFIAQSGQLTFDPGDGPKTITVPVIGDFLSEGQETFFLNLTSITPTSVIDLASSDLTGVGTILDNDAEGFSISNAQVLEGTGVGTTPMTFTVTLSSPLGFATSVVVTAGAGGDTASSGSDYQPLTTTLNFAPGQASQTVTVNVVRDSTPETDETLTVTLSNPTGTTLLDPTGTGTIFDDDSALPPDMSFRFEIIDSADAGTDVGVGEAFTLNVYVLDETGRANGGVFSAYLDIDFLASAGLVNVNGPIAYSSIYNTVRTGDTSVDGLIDDAGAADGVVPLGPAEQFLMGIPLIAEASGSATFTGLPAGLGFAVTMYNYGTVPLNKIFYDEVTVDIGGNSFQIDDVSLNEGNTGTTDFEFTVTRFNPDANIATVVYTVNDGTATLGDNDYQPVATGTLTFTFTGNPADDQKTITVPVIGDLKNEANETFTVTLSAAVGSTIGDGTGLGTIINDDAAPTVSIADASGSEGTSLSFQVTLSEISGQQVLVPFSTALDVGPNAASGGDFTATSGILTFAAGETTQFVSVVAVADVITPENNETFLVQLGSPTNAAVADGTATGTIIDAAPAGITGVVYVDANNDGEKAPTGEPGLGGVIITLTTEAGVVVDVTTTDAAGAYQFLSVPAGRYFVTETQPGFYTDGKEVDPDSNSAIVSVTNDQYLIDLTINPAATGINFGEKGILPDFLAAAINRRIFFATTLGNPVNTIGSPIVNADLTNGDIWVSFDAGWDGLRKFQSFFTSGSVTLRLYDLDRLGKPHLLATSTDVNGVQQILWTDALETPAKPLFLRISGISTNASTKIIDTLRAEVDNNPSVVNETVVENGIATVKVKLSAPQTADVVVQYATANNTAISGADYTAVSGTLTFLAGETLQSFTVPILADALDEDNESFFVNLTGASSFVEVAPGPFAVTILDDDQSPKLNIGDFTINEGDGGTTNAVFNVTLSAISGRTVTVAYTTAAGTAIVDGDFTAVSGTLTFLAGTQVQTIAVPILGDTFLEADETFSVALAGAIGASILDGVAVGVIANDDAGPQFLPLALPLGSQTSGSVLASFESSSSSSTSSATNSTTSSGSTADPLSGYTRRTASRGRVTTGAVDAALSEEEDWMLVA